MNCYIGMRAMLAIMVLCLGITPSIAKKSNKSKNSADTAEAIDAPQFPSLGFTAQCVSNLEGDKTDCEPKSLDPKDRLTVVSVQDDSPANQAGLAAGDIVVSIGGVYLSKGKTAISRLEEEIIPILNWSEPVPILVIRDGYTRQLTVPARSG